MSFMDSVKEDAKGWLEEVNGRCNFSLMRSYKVLIKFKVLLKKEATTRTSCDIFSMAHFVKKKDLQSFT